MTRHASLPPAPRPRQPVWLPCRSTDQKSPRRPAVKPCWTADGRPWTSRRWGHQSPDPPPGTDDPTRALWRSLSSRAFAGTLGIARGRSVSIGRSGHGRGRAGPSTTYSSHGRVARGPTVSRTRDGKTGNAREEAEPGKRSSTRRHGTSSEVVDAIPTKYATPRPTALRVECYI